MSELKLSRTQGVAHDLLVLRDILTSEDAKTQAQLREGVVLLERARAELMTARSLQDSIRVQALAKILGAKVGKPSQRKAIAKHVESQLLSYFGPLNRDAKPSVEWLGQAKP